MNIQQKKLITWEIDIKILNNRGVMKEVFKVFGISALFPTLLVLILWVIEGFPTRTSFEDWKYALFFLGIVLVITVLIILITGNKYPTRYEITSSGVTFITLPKQRKRNKIMGAILFVSGLFKDNPTNMGIGIITSNRQEMYTEWKKVKKVVLHKKGRYISLISSDLRKNILFCNEDNVEEVFQTVSSYCPKAKISIKG